MKRKFQNMASCCKSNPTQARSTTTQTIQALAYLYLICAINYTYLVIHLKFFLKNSPFLKPQLAACRVHRCCKRRPLCRNIYRHCQKRHSSTNAEKLPIVLFHDCWKKLVWGKKKIPTGKLLLAGKNGSECLGEDGNVTGRPLPASSLCTCRPAVHHSLKHPFFAGECQTIACIVNFYFTIICKLFSNQTIHSKNKF